MSGRDRVTRAVLPGDLHHRFAGLDHAQLVELAIDLAIEVRALRAVEVAARAYLAVREGVRTNGGQQFSRERETAIALRAALDGAGGDSEQAYVAAITPRPLAEWHEDDGPVLWWRFPIEEPPYVGTPLDDDWPVCMKHWTRFLVPEEP